MKGQKENIEWHTKHQITKAKEAWNSHQIMMHSSIADFKNTVKFKHIEDCLLTVEDIKVAKKHLANTFMH